MLISTTATNAEANYSSGTTYTLGAIVSYNAKRYESLQASNTNHQPDISPTWWLLLGADNKHAMFDNVVSTSTTATTSLTVVFSPGSNIDTVALIDSKAAIVTITVRDGLAGPIVYENTAGFSGSTVGNWYEYYFNDPLIERSQVIFYGIPPYVNAHITLVFTNSSGETVSCAQAVFGSLFDIGGTQYGANAGIIDYSRKETDEFGNISFIERPFSKRLSADVYVSNTDLNRVQNLLYSVRAKPSVWIASTDPSYEQALVLFGFFREFTTAISYPSHSMLNIDIEGLA
jgi:hypothetical protein